MAESESSFLESSTKIFGYLFALSIVYYLSFWINFDINIFQYIAIEDIIKGIAYPLRFAALGIAGLFMIIVLLVFFVIVIEGSKRVKNKIFDTTKSERKITGILFVAALIASIAFAFFPEINSIGIAASFSLSFLLVTIFYIVEDEDGKNLLSEIAQPYAIYCGIFLLTNAVISGAWEANRIKKGIEYNYVLRSDFKDKLKSKSPYLIFLGAVSDKYIFIDASGFERFIVDKSELPVLKVHHYNRADIVSVGHLGNMLDIERGTL